MTLDMAADRDPVDIAIAIVQRATGVRIDLAGRWTPAALRDLGCDSDLATEVATLLRDRPSAREMEELFDRSDAVTIAHPSTAISGLQPIGDAAPPAFEARGSRAWRPRRAARG